MTNKQSKLKVGTAKEAILAEPEMIKKFGKRIGATLISKNQQFVFNGNKISVQIDGYSEKPPYLCETWAGCKAPLPGQKWKIMKDALKLIFVEKMLGKPCKKVLIFSNKDAQKPFISSKSWIGACLKEFSIKTEVVKLSKIREKKRRKEVKTLKR